MVLKGLNIDGVIKVDNARVYGLEESIVASGYPMQIDTYDLDEDELDEKESRLIPKDIKRAKHLGNAVPGSGHDCFLKGIIVQFDLQVPEYIWRQLDRYHFIDYISSQSKMHRITKINLDSVCNRYVYDEVKEMALTNPHGMGLMWQDGKTIQYKKGFFNVNEFYDFYSEVKSNPKTGDIALHFRIGTGSNIDGANCHPFPITSVPKRIKSLKGTCDVGVMMNGIIGSSTKEFSDTALYVMKNLKEYYDIDRRFFMHFSKRGEMLFENDIETHIYPSKRVYCHAFKTQHFTLYESCCLSQFIAFFLQLFAALL